MERAELPPADIVLKTRVDFLEFIQGGITDSLKEVDLAGPCVEIEELAVGLAQNTLSIGALRVQLINLGERRMCTLLGALATNTTLTVLVLYDGITRASMAALAQALKTNTTLTALFFDSHERFIRSDIDDCMRILAEIIVETETLESIVSIPVIPIFHSCFDQLFSDALKKNTSLLSTFGIKPSDNDFCNRNKWIRMKRALYMVCGRPDLARLIVSEHLYRRLIIAGINTFLDYFLRAPPHVRVDAMREITTQLDRFCATHWRRRE